MMDGRLCQPAVGELGRVGECGRDAGRAASRPPSHCSPCTTRTGVRLAGIEWAYAVLQRRLAAGTRRPHTIRNSVVAQVSRLASVAGRSGRLIGTIETHLRAWPSVGLLLALLTGILLVALAR